MSQFDNAGFVGFAGAIGQQGPQIRTVVRGTGTVELEVTGATFGKTFLRDLRVVARSLATTAANSIRARATDEFKRLIVQRILEDPDVQSLKDSGSQLVAALGIASTANIDGYIRGSLEQNLLDSTSGQGIGSGATSATKGTAASMLPLTRTGFGESGVDNFFDSPWGTYTYTNRKKQTVTIPWLSWMKDPVGVKVPGHSVEFGDFPTTRTGNARMKRGGSFSVRRFLAGDNKNILERTLTNTGFLNTLSRKYASMLEDAMGQKSIQERALAKARFRTIRTATDTGRDSAQLPVSQGSSVGVGGSSIEIAETIISEIEKVTGEAFDSEARQGLFDLAASDPNKLVEVSRAYLGTA